MMKSKRKKQTNIIKNTHTVIHTYKKARMLGVFLVLVLGVLVILATFAQNIAFSAQSVAPTEDFVLTEDQLDTQAK